MIGQTENANPNPALRAASLGGICQTNVANSAATPSPLAADTAPDFRSPPINTSRTTSGTAAASAESGIEPSGLRG
jgi:hypothetical protein